MPSTTRTVIAEGLGPATALEIAPDDTMLVTVGSEILSITPAGTRSTLRHDLTDVATSGAGLLDLALAPGFPATPEIYLCYRTDTDIRVVSMTTDRELTSARSGLALLTGLPLPRPGEVGCHIEFGPDAHLYIGTSDGGDPRAPQALESSGGKILRLDVASRRAPADNPFIDRSDPITQLVYSYGHRDITGLAWHPNSATMYAIDRGPNRENEVDVIVPGGNYGWDPASRSTSNYQTDGVPMTDLSISGARPAAWNSGTDSPGLGPALFVAGSQWGSLSCDLVISNTAGPRVLFLSVTGEVIDQPTTLPTVNPLGPTTDIDQDAAGNLLVIAASGDDERLLRLSVTS